GLLSTASAAMNQAEAAAKEIQQNEEASKWADQVRGNVGALRGLGMPFCFRSFYPLLFSPPSHCLSFPKRSGLDLTTISLYRRRAPTPSPPDLHQQPKHPCTS